MEIYIDEVKNHATIDSLAIELYDNYDYTTKIGIKCSNLYGYLKYLLSSFFLFEQNAHQHDSRYDTLLKKILTHDGNIPENKYFLTWNYDMQLEIAYYLKTRKFLPVCIPVEKEGYTTDAKVFKINGSANYFNVNHMDCMVVKKKKELAERIFNQFAISHSDDGHGFSSGTTDLYFSWEKEVFDNKSVFLKRNIKGADILVIIGYSFPKVNEKIDKEILDSMCNLQKVYVQDCCPDNVIQNLKPLLSERLTNNIASITDISEFFIPELCSCTI